MDNNNLFDDLEDKEIDDLMKYSIPFSEDNERSIKNKFTQKAQVKQKKFSFKKRIVLVAIAVTFLFSTLVYAGVIDISRIYQIVFGDNSNYLEEHIKTYDNESKSDAFVGESEYDGIVLKLISAVNDEGMLRVFLTMTDTTKDRLSETMSLDTWSLSQGSGGSGEIIDYNKETKTATILITSSGNNHSGNVTFNIDNILSSKAFKKDIKENEINVYDMLKDHTPKIISQDQGVWVNGGAYQSEEGEALALKSKLLSLDQKDVKFDNIDWSHISNIGFVDGYLHIQTNIMRDNENDLASINFVNAEGEILYNGHLLLSYIDNGDGKIYADSKKYKEMIYEDITDIEQLKDLFVSIDFLEMGKVIEGNWKISFNVPDKMTKIEINVNREILLNENSITIDTIFLSPLGITMQLPKNVNYSNGFDYKDSVSVKYTDGTIVRLDSILVVATGNEISTGVFEKDSTLSFSGNIVEIEKVEYIIINDDVISIK